MGPQHLGDPHVSPKPTTTSPRPTTIPQDPPRQPLKIYHISRPSKNPHDPLRPQDPARTPMTPTTHYDPSRPPQPLKTLQDSPRPPKNPNNPHNPPRPLKTPDTSGPRRLGGVIPGEVKAVRDPRQVIDQALLEEEADDVVHAVVLGLGGAAVEAGGGGAGLHDGTDDAHDGLEPVVRMREHVTRCGDVSHPARDCITLMEVLSPQWSRCQPCAAHANPVEDASTPVEEMSPHVWSQPHEEPVTPMEDISTPTRNISPP